VHSCLCTTELYTAIYTYTSDEAGDLTFNEGDVISVVRTDGEWWTGSIGQRSGIFPGNFVKKYEERQVAAPAAAVPVEEVDLACSFTVMLTDTCLPTGICKSEHVALCGQTYSVNL